MKEVTIRVNISTVGIKLFNCDLSLLNLDFEILVNIILYHNIRFHNAKCLNELNLKQLAAIELTKQ